MARIIPIDSRRPAQAVPSPEEERDRRLGAALRRGEMPALEELLALHWNAVADYAERLLGSPDDAEDVVQHAFTRLWERRYRWGEDGSIRGFLYRVARNYALNEKRRQRVRSASEGMLQIHQEKEPPTPEEVRAGHELERSLEAAIRALPERRREVFILVRFHGLSYAQVAEVMEISYQTVANQMSVALARLREVLTSHDESPEP